MPRIPPWKEQSTCQNPLRVSGPNRKRGGLFARQCWRPSAHFQESQHAGVTEPQDQAEKGKINER